jgi:hypothetical protein
MRYRSEEQQDWRWRGENGSRSQGSSEEPWDDDELRFGSSRSGRERGSQGSSQRGQYEQRGHYNFGPGGERWGSGRDEDDYGQRGYGGERGRGDSQRGEPDWYGGERRWSGERDYGQGNYGFAGERGWNRSTSAGQRNYGGERGFGGQRGSGQRGWSNQSTYDGERDFDGQSGSGQRGERDFGQRGYGQGDAREFGAQDRYASGAFRSQSGYGGPDTYGGGQYRGGYGESQRDWGQGYEPRGAWGGEFSGGTYGPRGQRGRFGASAGRGGSESGQQSFRGRGPQSYQRSDDRIREELCDLLTDDDAIDASSIEVRVARGEVTLTGTVPDRQTKRDAEDMAESISGVRNVRNELRVEHSLQAGGQQQGATANRSATAGSTTTGGAASSESGARASETDKSKRS